MKKIFALLILPAFLYSGCTETQQYGAGGAAMGAAAGAIIGNQSGAGARDKGALIGAIIGGLGGTALGQKKEMDSQRPQGGSQQVIAVCPSCNSKVDVTGFPAHSTVECPNCHSKFTY